MIATLVQPVTIVWQVPLPPQLPVQVATTALKAQLLPFRLPNAPLEPTWTEQPVRNPSLSVYLASQAGIALVLPLPK